jgi:hypothetical protein
MKTIYAALRQVLAQRRYAVLALGSFLLFLLLYLMTLPASYTGGVIGPVALPFLDAMLIGFSLLMAALAGLLLPLIVYLLRQGRAASKSTAAGGMLVGLLTPLLCCSPLLPVGLGMVASVFPTMPALLGPRVQGFIANHQAELFTAASLFLLLALYQNARRVVTGARCVPAGPPA